MYYKLNILKEGPSKIPKGLLMREDVHSKIIDGTLTYFESCERGQAHQVLAIIKLRTNFNSILDFEKSSNGQDNKNLTQDVIRYINDNFLTDILSYNTSNKKHFLTEAIGNKDIMEAFFKKLALDSQD